MIVACLWGQSAYWRRVTSRAEGHMDYSPAYRPQNEGPGRHYTQRPQQGKPGLRTNLKASRRIPGPQRERGEQASLFSRDHTCHFFLGGTWEQWYCYSGFSWEKQWGINESKLECLIASLHEGAHSEDSSTLAEAHRVQGSLEANQPPPPPKSMLPVGTSVGQGQSARACIPKGWQRPTAPQWSFARWKPAKGQP